MYQGVFALIAGGLFLQEAVRLMWILGILGMINHLKKAEVYLLDLEVVLRFSHTLLSIFHIPFEENILQSQPVSFLALPSEADAKKWVGKKPT